MKIVQEGERPVKIVQEGERPVKIVHEVAPKRYIVQRLSKEHEARPEWLNESGWNELHKAVEDAESWGEVSPDTPVRVIDALKAAARIADTTDTEGSES